MKGNFFSEWSIRWRITSVYVILMTAAMFVLGGYLSGILKDTQITDLRVSLVKQGELINRVLEASGERALGDGGEYSSEAREWSQVLGVRVTLIDPQGIVVGESHEDIILMDNHLSRPEIRSAQTDGMGSSIRFSQTVGYEMLYVALPFLVNGELGGFVRLSVPINEIDANATKFRWTIFTFTLMVLGVVIMVALVISERITRPLRELTREAYHMAGEIAVENPRFHNQDEIGQLALAFNMMDANIQQQIYAIETEKGKLTAILNEMTNGVIILDGQGRITLINRMAGKLFEVEASNVLGRSLVQVVRHYQVVGLWEACKTQGAVQSETIEIGLSRKFIQVVAVPLEDQALLGSILMVFQDLTRIRQLETVRKDFISNISHELRTPLASLKALSETLLGGAIDDPVISKRFLGRIETEVDALALMVQELLELSQIESGKAPLKIAPVSPCNLILAAVDRLVIQAERKNVDLRTKCPPGLPDIQADPPRMEQVLVNLLHNAIKFTPDMGKITLSARHEGGYVLFRVEDSGQGISKEDLPRIFERFFKTDRSRSGGGTGLGLAISRHLVEMHGGKIWAESIEGKGSVFSFTIPIMGAFEGKV